MKPVKRIYAIMASEIRLSARNRWILLSTAMLAAFALALAFMSAGPGSGLKTDVLSVTSASLATLSVYLIPLIGLLLSYDSISGEIERGTLGLVLATPVSRTELLAGKFLGHLCVMSVAILIGYGIAAIALIFQFGMGDAGLWAWFRLIVTSIALGAVFIAGGIFLSAGASRTGTAAALVIGLWLLVVVLYDLALLAGLVIDGGGFFTKSLFPLLVLANPGDAYRLYNLAALEINTPVAGIDGLARTMPFPPATALWVLAAWLCVLLTAGFLTLRRLRP